MSHGSVPGKAALLKKFKDKPRDPGFRPADFLGDGSALLEKAQNIKGFLKGQRSRTDGHNAKTEWLLAAQQLQDEQVAAEKELGTSLRNILALPDPDMVAFASDMLNEWQEQCANSRALHAEMRQQMAAVMDTLRCIRQQGVMAAQDQAQALLQELQTLDSANHQECQSLQTQLEAAMSEIQSIWPTAMGAPHGPQAPAGSAGRRVLSLSPSPSLNRAVSLEKPALGRPALLPAIPEQHAAPAWGYDEGEAQDGWEGHTAAGWAAANSTGSGTVLQGAAGAAARDAQQLDQMIACYPLANDTAKARVRMVFAALRHRHQEKLDTWHADAGQVHGAGSAGGALSATGGWPEAEHSLFVSLRMKCWRDRAGVAGKAASRDALMKQLAVLMPSRTLTELVAHDDWLTNYKLMQRKRRGLLDAWSREKAQFLEDSASLLEESHSIEVAKAEAAAHRLVHELEREALHDNLVELRAIAKHEAEARAAQQADQEAVEAERQAAANALAKEELARNKVLIAAYRAQLQRKLEAEAEAAAAQQASADAARQVQAEYNKERVEWRHAEYLIKQDKQREAVAFAEAEAAAREERLARLRALVAPEVSCDPMRVLLPTEASSAVDDKLIGAFKAVNGYTVDQVYKDKRMRVWEALNAAGLAHTQYGRLAVLASPAATQTRIDNMTSDQRLLT